MNVCICVKPTHTHTHTLTNPQKTQCVPNERQWSEKNGNRWTYLITNAYGFDALTVLFPSSTPSSACAWVNISPISLVLCNAFNREKSRLQKLKKSPDEKQSGERGRKQQKGKGKRNKHLGLNWRRCLLSIVTRFVCHLPRSVSVLNNILTNRWQSTNLSITISAMAVFGLHIANEMLSHSFSCAVFFSFSLYCSQFRSLGTVYFEIVSHFSA